MLAKRRKAEKCRRISNTQFAARAVERVVDNNKTLINPLCNLRGLDTRQPGERSLIPVVVFFDVIKQWHTLNSFERKKI
ncbi:TPA: hypothetical protein ACYSBW_001546 [Klebsiella aerogenes]|nr:hypothetical protein SR83_05405 [Klebsiella aerogenes]KJO46575.1 hypothetical protein SR82_11960 [Klebsiella aerogenes]KJO49307.1 hypothetical protein SR85_13635 [Klebsiella aerogenes]